MRLVRSAVSRYRRVAPRRRCHPLVRHGGAELDEALLRLHAAQEMGEFWESTRRVLHAALPLHVVCMCLRPFALMPATVFRERAPFATEEEFRRFQQLSPVQAYVSVRPGTPLVRLSDIVPADVLTETEFYRCFMQPQDDRYYACLNFWHGRVFRGLVGLYRTGAQHDFTDAELALLAQLQPHFDTVLQRILDLHRERAVRLSLEKLLANLPIATVLLDWDLNVVSWNHSAVELCAIWNLGRARAGREKLRDGFDLPEVVLDFCTRCKAAWGPCHHGDPALTSPCGVYLAHPEQPGLRACVTLLQLHAAPLSMPVFLIRLEDNSPSYPVTEHGAGSALALLARLSPRERDVARLVGQGCRNEEVARTLCKSVLTVKRQLRSIYQKLNVDSRCRLAALLH